MSGTALPTTLLAQNSLFQYATVTGGTIGTYTTVATVEAIKPPTGEYKAVDCTKLADTTVQTKPGKLEYKDAEVDLQFDATLYTTLSGTLFGQLIACNIALEGSTTRPNLNIVGWMKALAVQELKGEGKVLVKVGIAVNAYTYNAAATITP